VPGEKSYLSHGFHHRIKDFRNVGREFQAPTGFENPGDLREELGSEEAALPVLLLPPGVREINVNATERTRREESSQDREGVPAHDAGVRKTALPESKAAVADELGLHFKAQPVGHRESLRGLEEKVPLPVADLGLDGVDIPEDLGQVERPTTLGKGQAVEAERLGVDVQGGALAGHRAVLPSGAADREREEQPLPDPKIDWLRSSPYLLIHAACIAPIWVGYSHFALALAFVFYVGRMFAITGFYHRYFSHRTFKTSRAFQFVMAVWGETAVQRGPLWWAAHHRRHHKYSDEPLDEHSPRLRGFWMSHCGWFLTRGGWKTHWKEIPDLARFKELCWLDKNDLVVPVLFGAFVFGLGALLERVAPSLGTNGPQLFVWAFIISTVFNWHATYTINSLSHVIGKKRYPTTDDSRNNPALALLTLGEGWHNNHHRYPGSTRQGFAWYELDITYLGLKVFSWLRIVKDLRPVPKRILEEGGLA
jgi:stearoyl-CoA desaturase (delta-9 desaturase)